MLDKITGGVIGFAVADALGVPVEFMSREEIALDPVTDMRGWGTYMQPPGTWSDDTGMMLATMDSLIGGYDPENIMQKFVHWSHGEYWPYGKVFDMGNTTNTAIGRYVTGVPALACGLSSENSLGNGSLMRILPLSVYLFAKYGTALCRHEQGMKVIHQVSKLTHAHPRAFIACGIYLSIAMQLMAGLSIHEAAHKGLLEAAGYYLNQSYADQLNHYTRLADLQSFCQLPLEQIRSTGYVVDTLEAALYCLLTTSSYKECVLKAVNLGSDTDTVAAVAGGLAGMAYGIKGIPAAWQLMVPQTGYMLSLCDALYVKCFDPHGNP